jgi:hypothetical protein
MSRVKWPGHEADHSPPYNARVKIEWVYIFTCPYVFMVCTGTALPLTHRPVITEVIVAYSVLPYFWMGSVLPVCSLEQIIVTLSVQCNGSFANTDVPLNLVTIIFTGFITYNNLQELCATGCSITKVLGYTG